MRHVIASRAPWIIARFATLWILLSIARCTANIEKLDACKAIVDGLVVNLEPIGKRDGTPSFHVIHNDWSITFNPCVSYNMPPNPHSGLGDQCLYVAMCKSHPTALGERLYTMGIQSRATFSRPSATQVAYWLLTEREKGLSSDEADFISSDFDDSDDSDRKSEEEKEEDRGENSNDDSQSSEETQNDGADVNSAEIPISANASKRLDARTKTNIANLANPAKSKTPAKRRHAENVIQRAWNAFRKQKPYTVAVLEFEGIKSLRLHRTSIILVCDVTRVAATDAVFDVIETPHRTRNTYFQLRHVCCCPGACPNGTSRNMLSLANNSTDENPTVVLHKLVRHSTSPARTVPRLLWLIIIVNTLIILSALVISNMCGRKNVALTGPYNYLPALHGSRMTASVESGVNIPNTKRKRYMLEQSYHKQRDSKLPPLHNCVVTSQQLQIGQRLGGGLFCDTYMAYWLKRCVAAKRITVGVHKSPLDMEEGKWLANEITLLGQQNHKNLVQVLGICLDTKEPYILTDYIHGDSLKDLLHPNCKNTMTLTTKIKMCIQCADGMAYLHSAKVPILHRDLRCANIMVDVQGHAKVVDFGHIRLVQKFRQECTRDECFCQKERSALPASLRWTAPEVLSHPTADETNYEIFTRSCDIYSYGMVLWEVATSREPFEEIVDENEVKKLVLKGIRPSVETILSSVSQYIDLMNMCWAQNPDERPQFKEVLSHLKVILQAAKALSSVRHRLGSTGSRQFLRSVRSLDSANSGLIPRPT